MTGALLRDRKLDVARQKASEAIDFVGLCAKQHAPARDLTTIDQPARARPRIRDAASASPSRRGHGRIEPGGN